LQTKFDAVIEVIWKWSQPSTQATQGEAKFN